MSETSENTSENPVRKKRGRPRKSVFAPSVRETIEELVAVPSVKLSKRGPQGPQKRPRKTTKKQVSVRIDERLLETATQRAQKQRLSLTDAIEQGLWLYLGEERAEATTQLRFLVAALPLAMQKRLLNCAAFMNSKELNPSEERTRTFFCQVLDLFGQDARAQNVLGSLRPEA